MSNGDIGFWTGSISYQPSWSASPFAVNFGATDASGVDWLWMSIQGWDSPSVVGSVVQRAADHGGWPTEQYFAPRTMTITIHASAPSQALRDAARATLQQALPVNDLATLVYNEPISKTTMVRRSGQITETYPTLADVEFQCVLVAPDPRKYNTTAKTVSTTLAGTITSVTLPTTVPFSLANNPPSGSVQVTNIGNFETRPNITIFGPVTAPSVTMLDTGQIVSFSQVVLNVGDTLVISTDNKYGMLNGSYRPADISSSWWVVNPGTYTLELGGQTSSSSSMTVNYSDAWV